MYHNIDSMEAGKLRIIETLLFKGFEVKLFSFSALDKYLDFPVLPFAFMETNADISQLAHFADELCFPGADLADAAMDEVTDKENCRIYFRCRENYEQPLSPSYNLLSLVYDCKKNCFLDTQGIYPLIRSIKNNAFDGTSIEGWWDSLNPNACGMEALINASLLLARYNKVKYPPKDFIEMLSRAIENKPAPNMEAQQMLLIGLMASSRPDRGLELLKASGFLKKHWPEIARLDDADHLKEFHPEGNAWKHTLKTFEHRKHNSQGQYDLCLSLALLLHDIGKPLSQDLNLRNSAARQNTARQSVARPFDGHAELGARAAANFLERLEFDILHGADTRYIIDNVYYLVKNHMLPAALARLPLMRTGDVMSSPLFPSLMELYRCDESSSFKGLDSYYENSAAYQAFLRNRKNPYRSLDGRVYRPGRSR